MNISCAQSFTTNLCVSDASKQHVSCGSFRVVGGDSKATGAQAGGREVASLCLALGASCEHAEWLVWCLAHLGELGTQDADCGGHDSKLTHGIDNLW